MHDIIQMDTVTNRDENKALNWDADLLVVQNLTAESIHVRIGGLDYPTNVIDSDVYVPPFTMISHSVRGSQFAFMFGLPGVLPVPVGSPTTALITLSKNEPSPTFAGMPVTNVNAAVQGAVDANITNPALTVNGTVSANVTNAELTINQSPGTDFDMNIADASINIPTKTTQQLLYSVTLNAGISDVRSVAVSDDCSTIAIFSTSVGKATDIIVIGDTTGLYYHFALGTDWLGGFPVAVMGAVESTISIQLKNASAAGATTYVVMELIGPTVVHLLDVDQSKPFPVREATTLRQYRFFSTVYNNHGMTLRQTYTPAPSSRGAWLESVYAEVVPAVDDRAFIRVVIYDDSPTEIQRILYHWGKNGPGQNNQIVYPHTFVYPGEQVRIYTYSQENGLTFTAGINMREVY